MQSLLSVVKPAENAGTQITLIKTPETLLQNLETPVTLTGKIIEHQQNQALTIKTDSGTILAKSISQQNLQAGDPVLITITKNNSSTEIQAFIQKTAPPTNQQRADATTTDLSSQTRQQAALPTPKTLLNIARVEIRQTSAQELRHLTQVPIEKIDTKLPLQSKISIQGQNQGQGAIHSPKSHIISANTDRIITEQIRQNAPPILSQKNEAPQIRLRVPHQDISAIKTQPNIISALNTSHNIQTSQPTQINVRTINLPSAQFTHKGQELQTQNITPLQNTNLRAGQVQAQLVGFTKSQNFPVLQIIPNSPSSAAPGQTTPQSQTQHITIQRPIDNFQIGTRLTINITQAQSVQNTDTQTHIEQSRHAMAFLTPDTSWPTLTDIEHTLHLNNPALAQNFTNTLPSPAQPNHINAASLFFLAAMRSGDVQSWLGDKASDLLKILGKSDLLNALGGELSSLNTLNTESATQEWRSLSLPMHWQDEIHQIVLHYRKQNNGEHGDQREDGETTRFVMDFKLSNIGDLQIDGLYAQHQNKPQRLDLILRSEQSFSEAMRVNMQDLYQSALHNAGFDGMLGFQQKEHWVQVTQDLKPEFIENI